MHVSVQCVALEPARGLLVEFYGHPVTSVQRKPWSEAHAVFRVVLRSPFWKEIKRGEASSSQVQSCCGCSANHKWFSGTIQGIRFRSTVKVKMTERLPEGCQVSSGLPPSNHGGQVRVFLSIEDGGCRISYLSVGRVFPFLK